MSKGFLEASTSLTTEACYRFREVFLQLTQNSIERSLR